MGSTQANHAPISLTPRPLRLMNPAEWGGRWLGGHSRSKPGRGSSTDLGHWEVRETAGFLDFDQSGRFGSALSWRHEQMR